LCFLLVAQTAGTTQRSSTFGVVADDQVGSARVVDFVANCALSSDLHENFSCERALTLGQDSGFKDWVFAG